MIIPIKQTLEPTFQCYLSPVDNTPVLQIDTFDMPETLTGPILRIYLNDHPIYENPEYPLEE